MAKKGHQAAERKLRMNGKTCKELRKVKVTVNAMKENHGFKARCAELEQEVGTMCNWEMIVYGAVVLLYQTPIQLVVYATCS